MNPRETKLEPLFRHPRSRRLRRKRPSSKGPAQTIGIKPVRPFAKLRTIDETAELLNTSTRTIRRFIDSGALPVHRLGRSVRISDADIAAFLAATRSV